MIRINLLSLSKRERKLAQKRQYYEQNKKTVSVAYKEKYDADPEFRAARLANANAWKQKNPDRCRANQRAWSKLNPDKVKASRDRMYMARRLRTYGPVIVELLEKTCCEICSRSLPTTKSRCVDHDHATGKVRGILCVRCNSALGMMRDSPSLLRNAANYLENHRGD